ncbi:MAG: hypothetical protein EBR30_23330 [Cytophagia bacterium]|nr:hypothetical protein [Cytophagia bacterium]
MLKFIFSFFLIMPLSAIAQFGINLPVIGMPAIGLNYEIKDTWRPEIRISRDLDAKPVNTFLLLTRDIINYDNHEAYLGIGIRSTKALGAAILGGVNLYPFKKKKFGFNIDQMIVFGDRTVDISANLGIRYRFKSGESNSSESSEN